MPVSILLALAMAGCAAYCIKLFKQNRMLRKKLEDLTPPGECSPSRQETFKIRERLRIMQDSSNFGMWDIDISTRRIEFDENFKKLIGYEGGKSASLDELKEHLKQHMNAERCEALFASILDYSGDNEKSVFTEAFEFEGKPRYIRNYGKILRDADGMPEHLIGTALDVTESETIMRKLKSTQTSLEVALESSLAGIWEIFREGDEYFIHYEENFAKLFKIGHTRPFTLPAWADYLADILDSETSSEFFNFLRNFEFIPERIATNIKLNFPDGSVSYIKNSARMSYNEDGAPRSMVGMCVDISDRVRALDEGRQIAETILNSMDEHIYVSDIETDELLFVNTPILKAFNITGPYAGKKCWALFMNYDKRCDFCPKHQLDKDPDKVIVWENFQPLLEKHSRHIDKYITWLDGKKVLFHTMFDVTDIRRAEKEIVEAKNAAEQASKAKSRFLSNMSHEIRTPMNAIIGMTAIALKENIPESTRHCLERISSASGVLLSLINNILDMSKIEADKLELVEYNFNLTDVLAGVTDIIQVKAQEKRQTLILQVDPAIPALLRGDSLRLTQVLTNVLSNAVKFSYENTEIALEITQVTADARSVKLLFKVSDQGIGMSEEQIRRLFSPFEQGDSGIAAQYGGTGLGLALSQRIVEKMDGAFTVSSSSGKGSIFAFSVRLGKVHGEEADKSKTEFMPAPGSLTGKSILLVDDVDINRDIVRALLESSEVKITDAENGLEAVKTFAKSPEEYDLILMDVQMPVMDGYQATGKIREISRDVPVIAMTANAFKEDVERSLLAGMDDHISKPVDEKELLKKVRRHISWNRAASG